MRMITIFLLTHKKERKNELAKKTYKYEINYRGNINIYIMVNGVGDNII